MTDRERFEEWAKLNTGRTDRCTEPGYTHQYQDSHTQMAWITWDTATKAEREACAKVCDAKANALGERADLCDDDEDAIELKARAWQMAVLAAELRECSNAPGKPTSANEPNE